MILTEPLELPAIADVVGVPSVEEAERFAGVATVVLTLAEELGLRFDSEHCWLFAFVLLGLASGVLCGRR